MGVAIRHLLIDQNDEVLSLDNRLFGKLWANAPEAVFPQFAGCRMRMAKLLVQLHHRRAVAVLQVNYSYAHFDGEGRFHKNKALQHAAFKMEAAMGDISRGLLSSETKTVIHASSRFAARPTGPRNPLGTNPSDRKGDLRNRPRVAEVLRLTF